MNQELVEWESEEKEMKENMELDEIREKSTKEKVSLQNILNDLIIVTKNVQLDKKILSLQVLDVVRAAELLASSENDLIKPKSPGGPKSGDNFKTTTIVMSKHTLEPQAELVSWSQFIFCRVVLHWTGLHALYHIFETAMARKVSFDSCFSFMSLSSFAFL